jgi:hypothetical protein
MAVGQVSFHSDKQVRALLSLDCRCQLNAIDLQVKKGSQILHSIIFVAQYPRSSHPKARKSNRKPSQQDQSREGCRTRARARRPHQERECREKSHSRSKGLLHIISQSNQTLIKEYRKKMKQSSLRLEKRRRLPAHMIYYSKSRRILMHRNLPGKLSKRTSCDRVNLIQVPVDDIVLDV